MRYASDRITRNRWVRPGQALDQDLGKRSFGIAERLRASRLVARELRPVMKNRYIGVDFSDLANLQVTSEKVILYVRTPTQKIKLRQILPSIQNAVAETGLVQPVDIEVRPTASVPEQPDTTPRGEPRQATEQNAEELESAAGELSDDSPLKSKLLQLARTLRDNAKR